MSDEVRSGVPEAPSPRVSAHPLALAGLLALLAMFGPFAIDTLFPAFPAVARDLGATAFAMQQTLSVYIVAYGVMALLHGPLSDAYGRRVVILSGVAVFTLASIGCALASSIDQLLAFRALQGLSSGAGLIVGRAIVRDCFEGAQAQRVMSLISLIFGVAPAIAPIVGGIIFVNFGWHAIFGFLALYAALLWLLCAFALRETHPPDLRTPLRMRALGSVYGGIVRDRGYLLIAFAGGLNFGALFLYISSAPAIVIGQWGLGATDFGWLFVPIVIGMMLGSATSARMAGRFTPAQTASAGFAVMSAGVLCNLAYAFAVLQPQPPWAILPVAMTAFGISLAFPAMTLLMLDRHPRQRGAASSMQAVVWASLNAAIAGIVAPSIAASPRLLAVMAAIFVAAGLACWWRYRTRHHREPAAAGARNIAEVGAVDPVAETL